MRFINSKVHGILDYMSGLLFIASPWLFGFADDSAAMWVPIIAGIAVLGMSLLTDYEMGAFRTIPLSVHLTMDVVTGILLLASPWLFGFSDYVYVPHVVFGILEIGAGLFTKRYVEGYTGQVHRA